MAKKEKRLSKKKIFWQWLGRQNVFLVFGVFFLMIYGSIKAYGGFFPDLNKNPKNIGEPSVKTTVSLTYSPTPNSKYPTITGTVEKFTLTNDPTPTLTITPTPTEVEKENSNSENVECSFSNNCGNEKRMISSEECNRLVCCYIEEGKGEIISRDECIKKQNDSLQKSIDEYNKVIAEYNQYVEKYNKAIGEEKEKYNQSLIEYKNKLLEECRNNAQATYKQKPIGSTTNSNTGAYVVGESQIVREQLNKALQTCNDLYGS